MGELTVKSIDDKEELLATDSSFDVLGTDNEIFIAAHFRFELPVGELKPEVEKLMLSCERVHSGRKSWHLENYWCFDACWEHGIQTKTS